MFVDFNQNARDHTIALGVLGPRGPVAAAFQRRSPGTSSTTIDPARFTIATVPARFAELGDLHAAIDDTSFDITPLLEWADRDGLEEAS